MATQNRYYSNVANVTSLANPGGINNTNTSLIVGNTTGFPAQFPFILRIEPASLNEEVVLVASGSGTSGAPYIVTRGFDGTTARTHGAGVVIKHGFSQIDFQDPQVHLNATGPGGAPNPHSLPDAMFYNPVIAETTLTTTAITYTFSSIPSSMKHLRLQIIGHSAASGGGNGFDEIYVQFNSDTSSNYTSHQIVAINNTTINENSNTATSNPRIGALPNGIGGSGIIVADITGYSFTTWIKNYVAQGHASSGVGSPNNFYFSTYGGVWNNAAAISSLTIGTISGSGLASSTFLGLYGVY